MFLIPIGRQQQKPRLTGRKFKSDQAHEQSLAPTANKRVKQHSIRPLRMAARAEPMMRETEFAGSVTYNSQCMSYRLHFQGSKSALLSTATAAIPLMTGSDGGNTMSNHSRSASFSVADYLNTPDRAAEYLNAAMEDGDERVLLTALRNVVRASVGMTSLAKKSGLARESIYRMLSEDGNPRLSSLIDILHALDLD